MEAVKAISSSEARESLPDLLARAAYAHEHTIIVKCGRPTAAIIGVDEYRLFERLLKKYEDTIDTEAALTVLADENDDIIPFERST